MKKASRLLLLLFQLLLTFATLFVIYMIYALFDTNEADMINGIGFIIFQPIYGTILAFITILICLALGLPIRLNSRLKQWWLSRPLIPVIGAIIGVILLVVAFNPNLSQTKQVVLDGETVNKEVPNAAVSITGWFVTAFSLLHFYPLSLFSLFRRRRSAIKFHKPTN